MRFTRSAAKSTKIADGAATRALKEVLLSDWRSEIALLHAERPQHSITRVLREVVHLYGLQCRDFLAVIDGMARSNESRIFVA